MRENARMGLLDTFRAKAVEPTSADVAAALPLPTIDSLMIPFNGGIISATREEAMSVPACARARNIICSAIASLPLEVWDRKTGDELEAPKSISLPDRRVTAATTYTWLAEDLLFWGYAYAQVKEVYADTQRVRDMERINPTRIEIVTNRLSTEIDYYVLDGRPLPNEGVGSLVVFYGTDEGLLNRAGKTIRAGAELERAAAMYAKEPAPTMVLKSNGSALPADRIAKLLEQWGIARRNRATAFLNADVSLETVGYDPEKLQLNQARSYIATEIARAVGIPAYFVDAETGSSMTYANANLARQTLVDFSLRPIMTAIEQRLSMPDFLPSSQVCKFSLDDYLRGSAYERAQVYEILNRIGAMSAEEIRMEEDMIK